MSDNRASILDIPFAINITNGYKELEEFLGKKDMTSEYSKCFIEFLEKLENNMDANKNT